MELFYSNLIERDTIILDSCESKHCIKVLRKSIGDLVNVVDGKGTLYKGSIVSFNNKQCQIQIKEKIKEYGKRDYYIHIAISVLKNHNRLEWFIEKSVELGIDEISFIYCQRTLKKTIKLNRIYKTAIVAMKQTLKAKIPKINNVLKLEDFLKNCFSENRYICHLEKNNQEDLFHFKKEIKNKRNSCVLIGPEGDFTLDEISFSEKCKFQPVTLGRSRLRSETAGIVACHLLNIINNK